MSVLPPSHDKPSCRTTQADVGAATSLMSWKWLLSGHVRTRYRSTSRHRHGQPTSGHSAGICRGATRDTSTQGPQGRCSNQLAPDSGCTAHTCLSAHAALRRRQAGHIHVGAAAPRQRAAANRPAKDLVDEAVPLQGATATSRHLPRHRRQHLADGQPHGTQALARQDFVEEEHVLDLSQQKCDDAPRARLLCLCLCLDASSGRIFSLAQQLGQRLREWLVEVLPEEAI
mmetsp:Transcript_157971/g.502987  ORF Transcript_157971/g.502987 Transcript_157971/m.502987 type:complete len:229 (-) Transcript_157971:410-1096(-)